MEFADYPGLNADLAADFHARHFARRDTHHMFSSDHHLGQMPQFNPAALAGLAVDVKPRLTKEQHDILEHEFRKQAKPNTNTKKRFAEVLGVSLDKVNNWFQNRRAKSKQDAKKQAGAFNLLQASHQPGFGAVAQGARANSTYCVPDMYHGMRDSAILDGPMSGGLGISQPEQLSNATMVHDFALDHMSSHPMRHQQSQQSLHSLQSHASISSLNDDFAADNRRTMTQAQFDAFNHADPFGSDADDAAAATGPGTSSTANDFYPEFCDFSFDGVNPGSLAATPMQPSHSHESFVSDTIDTTELVATAPRNASSSGSDGSAPCVSITPPGERTDSYDLDQADAKPQPAAAAAGEQWQPGQSRPIEIAALRQEFREAASRREMPMQSIPDVNDFLDQPIGFPLDDAYNRRESSSTVQLAHSMQNFSMAPQRSAMPSSSIAARRQRPRPAPLGTNSLRSTSYCGALPTADGPVGGNHNLGGHTLRRIKSSQAMNGIAGGRIQKNVGSAQRSPSNYATFSEANAGRFARRVSSFSPAYASLAATSASLAPPTPLSPTDVSANFALQGQPMMRQASGMSESADEFMVPGVAFSPPSTPMYANQFVRARLGSLAVPTENTPPQSAPPTQQCFPSGTYPQAVPMMQSQSQGGYGIMANEYPQMPSVYSSQQPAYQNMEMPMSYIMTNTGEVHMGYPVMPSFAQSSMQQQVTPPNQQQPFVPSSSLSPGALGSSQKHASAAADFFVHEYSPPQDVKQATTPRKSVAAGPKNYTFSNHGPEFFEKNAKHKGSSSPASSICEEAV